MSTPRMVAIVRNQEDDNTRTIATSRNLDLRLHRG